MRAGLRTCNRLQFAPAAIVIFSSVTGRPTAMLEYSKFHGYSLDSVRHVKVHVDMTLDVWAPSRRPSSSNGLGLGIARPSIARHVRSSLFNKDRRTFDECSEKKAMQLFGVDGLRAMIVKPHIWERRLAFRGGLE